MAEILESCCFNEPRDGCPGAGCPCGCHDIVAAPITGDIVTGDIVRDGLARLARDYLAEGVILGAASIGVDLTRAEIDTTLFSGDDRADGQQKLQALIRTKREERP